MNRFSDKNLQSLAIDTELPFGLKSVTENSSPSRLNFVDGSAKKIVLKKLDAMQEGSILLSQPGVKDPITLGEDLTTDPSQKLSATLKIVDPAFYRRTLLGGTIGAAESYIDGDWGTDNLTDLIRILIRNMGDISKMERTWSRARGLMHRWKHLRRKNTVSGSRKNIQDHYDLGNEFYSLFLDPTMSYSAGVFDADLADERFPDAMSEMHGASLIKMDRICQKLDLRPEDHVVEIGTGWGGLAIHMASRFGCQVTTTTISQQQFQYATEAIAKAGLEDKITVLLKDYRDLEGQFDKLVSVEMIEAVGHQFLDTYFAKCNALLKPNGAMLIQAILIGEAYHASYQKGVDFIRAYVFPGGCLPSAVTIGQSVGRVSEMHMLDYEDMTPHYAVTLMQWREVFLDRVEAVRALKFDDYFIRLWHFYLSYCEAAFAERRCQSVQIMFGKRDCPLDPATVNLLK